MIQAKYFEEYKWLIYSGKHIACKEQFLLIKYLETKILSRDDLYIDEKMLENYIKFSEKYFFPLSIYQKISTLLIKDLELHYSRYTMLNLVL